MHRIKNLAAMTLTKLIKHMIYKIGFDDVYSTTVPKICRKNVEIPQGKKV